MDTEITLSQWFDTMFWRRSAEGDPTENAAPLEGDDTDWNFEDIAPLQDVLRMLGRSDLLEEQLTLLGSLTSPSLVMLSQSAQAEINRLVGHSVESVGFGSDQTAPVTPYGQVAENGTEGSVYNAAFLPGWPIPAFAKNPENTTDEQQDFQSNEAEIVAYLSDQGLSTDLLSQVLASLKTASDRVGFLVWLASLIALANQTLQTLRREAIDPFPSEEELLDASLQGNRRIVEI